MISSKWPWMPFKVVKWLMVTSSLNSFIFYHAFQANKQVIVLTVVSNWTSNASHAWAVRLSAGFKMPIHVHFFSTRVFLTRKVGHGDLVFGVRSGPISRSAYASLQVIVCSRDGRYSRYPRYTAVPHFTVLVPWGSRYTVEVTVLDGTI